MNKGHFKENLNKIEKIFYENIERNNWHKKVDVELLNLYNLHVNYI